MWLFDILVLGPLDLGHLGLRVVIYHTQDNAFSLFPSPEILNITKLFLLWEVSLTQRSLRSYIIEDFSQKGVEKCVMFHMPTLAWDLGTLRINTSSSYYLLLLPPQMPTLREDIQKNCIKSEIGIIYPSPLVHRISEKPDFAVPLCKYRLMLWLLEMSLYFLFRRISDLTTTSISLSD